MHRSGPYLVEILQKMLVVVVPDTRWKARPSEQAPEHHTGPAVERRSRADAICVDHSWRWPQCGQRARSRRLS